MCGESRIDPCAGNGRVKLTSAKKPSQKARLIASMRSSIGSPRLLKVSCDDVVNNSAPPSTFRCNFFRSARPADR